VNKHQVKGTKVMVYNCRMSKGEQQDYYRELWGRVKDRIEKACGLSGGTIVLDTATELFELARLSHFGKTTQVMPHQYTAVNTEWRGLIANVYDSKMSMVMIHKLKAEYKNDKNTGGRILSGFGETPYLVQAHLLSYREDIEGGGSRFGLIVDKMRHNPSLNGFDLNPNMPVGMDFLINMVHGGQK